MLPRHPFMRLLAINALSGAALAGLIVTTLVVFDVGRLGTLLAGDHNPAVALAILFGSFVVTCASVMMGSAVMMLARGHADRNDGGSAQLVLVPVPVRARRGTRRYNS